jgi:hypothetical protein
VRKSLSAIALVLLMAQAATAQGGPGGAGARMGPPLDDDNFPPTVAALSAMLDLSSEQVAAIGPLRDSLLAATRSQREEARSLRATMRGARRSGAGPDSLAVLRQKLQEVMLGMMPARMQFHARIRPLLTEKQAAMLDARQEEMQGTMGQRMRRQPGNASER